MDLRIHRIKLWERILMWILIGLGIQSVLWFSDFWFFSEARRDPLWFPILTFAIFWGIYRSIVNWGLYFFITPENVDPEPQEAKLTGRIPEIDVLITAMPGEPYSMFADSLEKVQKMHTPHRTFLLDGGNIFELQNLCSQLGIQHVDCRGIQGAKAGKINYCLNNFCKGELVFIMDPDHRPRPDMLQRVLPYFQNMDIGFVQVVQAYYNANESYVADAAAEQTFGFYGPTLMSLHGLGIPTAIGANCVFRRTALDSIEGHAVHLAEDALTSMRLHAQGWKSAYLPYRGTDGLVPADLASFFKQQYKWATGMFYLLLREYPKLFGAFSWKCRIHYFNAGTFYFNGLATTLAMLLPIIFLFSGHYAVEFPLVEFLFHLLPYTLATVATYGVLQRFYTHKSERRIPWRSLTLDKGTFHIYLMALISGVLNRRVDYIPTPKNADKTPMPMAVLPHLITMVLSIAAIIYALFTYHRLDNGTLLMIFFAVLNVISLLPVSWIALFPRFNWRTQNA